MPGADVAVVVPMRDPGADLVGCLDSILGQRTSARLEVVVVDDGSTDGSRAVAEEVAARDPRLRVLTGAGRGAGPARNLGIASTTAPLVVFADADDELPPTSIERRRVAMAQPGVDLVVTAIEIFPVSRPWLPGVFVADRVLEGVDEEPRLLANRAVWNKMFHRAFFDDERNLFADTPRYQDTPVGVAALLDARRIALVAEPCYRYRQDEGARTPGTDARTSAEAQEWHLRIDEGLVARYRDDPRSLRLLDRVLVSTLGPFMENAATVLGPEGIPAVADRWRALLAHADPADLAPHVERALTRAALHAVLAGDDGALADLGSVVRGVRWEGDDPLLDVDGAEPRLRPLLALPPQRATGLGVLAASVDDADGGTLGGTVVTSSSLGWSVPPHDLRLRLAVGGREVTAATQPVAGTVATARWTADLPRDLPAGRHPLALVSPLLRAPVPIDAGPGALRLPRGAAVEGSPATLVVPGALRGLLRRRA